MSVCSWFYLYSPLSLSVCLFFINWKFVLDHRIIMIHTFLFKLKCMHRIASYQQRPIAQAILLLRIVVYTAPHVCVPILVLYIYWNCINCIDENCLGVGSITIKRIHLYVQVIFLYWVMLCYSVLSFRVWKVWCAVCLQLKCS